MTVPPQAELYDRAGELAEIDASVRRAQSGHGAVLAVEASAGMGKSSLLAAARRRAGGAGLQVLAARGGELEGGFSFGVVRQLVEPLLPVGGVDSRGDLQLAMTGNPMPFQWSDSYGARVGLLSRGDSSGPVRWFDVEPCYVFHVLNAVDDPDGAVTIDVCRYQELWRGGPDAWTCPQLHRWTIHPGTGQVRETALNDRAWDFPRIDERRTGQPYRYGYLVEDIGTDGADPAQARLVKTDLLTGPGPGQRPRPGQDRRRGRVRPRRRQPHRR